MNIILISLVELVGITIMGILSLAVFKTIKAKITYKTVYKAFKKKEILSTVCFNMNNLFNIKDDNKGDVFLISFMLEYHVVHILSFKPRDKNKHIILNVMKSFVAEKNKSKFSSFSSFYIVKNLIESSLVYEKCINAMNDETCHLEITPETINGWFNKFGWEVDLKELFDHKSFS